MTSSFLTAMRILKVSGYSSSRGHTVPYDGVHWMHEAKPKAPEHFCNIWNTNLGQVATARCSSVKNAVVRSR
jgi:hypothetical protein